MIPSLGAYVIRNSFFLDDQGPERARGAMVQGKSSSDREANGEKGGPEETG